MRALIAAAALGAAALSACSQPAQTAAAPETREALIAYGEYLVHGAVLCADCHTPQGPEGPDMNLWLEGAVLPFAPVAEMPFAGVAPPLAGLPACCSEAELAHFLETGERPSGVPALPPMPLYRLNDHDARAVAAYIASLPKPE